MGEGGGGGGGALWSDISDDSLVKSMSKISVWIL
jgi:hypothetical protein